ncbi:MAG: HlyD family efflux transporter periplasmic adaptor subunit [Chloroflexota bacterium]|nr:HlyD family efflux transporter periplasmic adaptor subunit [Chloroflexota bacterium]
MPRWIWVLLIIAVALAGCGKQAVETPADALPADEDGTPQPTLPPLPAGRAIVGDGQLISPYPSLALAFGGGVSGRILMIAVKAGDVVQAGDSLALLDDTELQRAADDAQLALDRAIADREQALEQWERDIADAEQALAAAGRALTTARLEYSDTSLEEARTALDRARQAEKDREWEYNEALMSWPPRPTNAYRDAWQRAIRDRELSEMRLADAEDSHSAGYLELDTREDDVTQAERKLAALQEGIEPTYERAMEDAESELAQAEEALEHVHLTAPWAAIVLSVDVAPEANVSAGTPVVTLLSIEDGLRFVTQNLSEQHIADIYPGQRAVVTLRTFAETPLEGTVEAVIPQIEEAVETDARFTIRVLLAPTDLRLLPGLTGRVEIFTQD